MKKELIIIMVILLICTNVYADPAKTDALTYEEFMDKVKHGEITDIEEMKSYNHFISNFVAEKFSDCENGSWYETGVGYLVGMGIVGGYTDGTFRPYNSIRVDEFLALIVRAMKYELIETEGYWGASYIETAKENGLLNGLAITNYCRTITRGEMALIIVNALDMDFDMELNSFKKLVLDFPQIETYQKEGILIAFSSGIITGYPNNTFRASNNATRAEAATMIIRLLDESERKAPILESHSIDDAIFLTVETYDQENLEETITGLEEIAVTDDYIYLLCDSKIKVFDKEMNFIQLIDDSKFSTIGIHQLFSYDDYILATSRTDDYIMKIDNNEIKWDKPFGESLIYTDLASNNYGDIVARRENNSVGLLASINLENYVAMELFEKELSQGIIAEDLAYIDDTLFLLESKSVDIWSLEGEKIGTIEFEGGTDILTLVYSPYYDRIFALKDNTITVINPYTFEKEKTHLMYHFENRLESIVIDNSGNIYAMDNKDNVHIMKNE